MNYLIVLIVSYLIYFSSAVNGSNVSHIINEKGILAIGETVRSVMVITKDFNVLTWDKKELNSETKQFPLKNVKYTPIEKLFPKFASNSDFQKIKNDIHTGYIHSYKVIDKVFEEINLLYYRSMTDKEVIRYVISNDTFIKGRTFAEIDDNNANVLTGYNSPQFYVFTWTGKALQVSAYDKIKKEGFRIGRQGLLCKEGQSIYFDDMKCEENPNWAEKRGFISGDFVLLFNSTTVTIFSEESLNFFRTGIDDERRYSFEEKSLEDFFEGSVIWAIIVLAVLVSFVISGCCAFGFLIYRNLPSPADPSSITQSPVMAMKPAETEAKPIVTNIGSGSTYSDQEQQAKDCALVTTFKQKIADSVQK